MSEALSQPNEPFPIQNREIALLLLTAGCEFAEPQNGGPAQMHFTPGTCRNRWVTRRDQKTGEPIHVPLLPHNREVSAEEFERAVLRAKKHKIPGVVTYFIKRNDVFREAMGMLDQLAKSAQEADLKGVPMTFPPFSSLTETQAAVVTLYARLQNDRMLTEYAWLRPVTCVLTDAKKKVVPIKVGTEEVPASILEDVSFVMEGTGKVWSLGLSNEQRAKVLPGESKPYLHPQPKI